MPRIEVECLRCGAKCVTSDPVEAALWSPNHDLHCLGPRPDRS